MMKLTHKDLDPNSDCDFEAVGNTAKEVAQRMLKHMKSEEPDAMGDMSDSDMLKKFEGMAHM